MTGSTAVDAQAAAELAAPLDLLLTDSVLGIGRRMLPSRAWLHFGESLLKRPQLIAGRCRSLADELADIARGRSTRMPARSDKRFADTAWSENPLLRRTMQAYLAGADTAGKLLDDADLDWRDRERMQFVIDNIVEAFAPTNNPLLNPLGYKALIDTGGASAVRGMSNLARDLATKPRVPAMISSDAFTLGDTVAATPGAVVYQSRVFELIQYTPHTPQVHSAPLLIVPPVINKFYVVDMAPGRSLVEYFLDQGQQVFAISWRNPKARHRAWGFDTYGQAIIDALDAVEQITDTDRTHLFATCSGGMLAAMTAAHLTDIGQGDRIAGLALGVTVLDQSRAGFAAAAMNAVTAKQAIRMSATRGYLDGRSLAEVFAWLRPTDLVWRYWVNNYIQGREPAPFDVLFWNADTTRMAAALHRDMVESGMANALAAPGGVTMLGTPVDLATIKADTYVIAGIADHISPWQACYRSARLLGDKNLRFVLSTSGHIASLVNPPGNPRASFRVGTPDAESPDEWLESADNQQDSWWPDYAAWLAQRSGSDKAAPEVLGTSELVPLTAAPGSYVREK
jgi:polyhydroxyalkanoate synthase